MNKPEPPEIQPPTDESRRRLAKAGLAVPVVLASLASKRALASVPYNCTVSGQLSGNTSSHGSAVSCNSLGRSPAYWISNSGGWPSAYTPNTKFGTVFSSYPSGYENKKLMEALQNSGSFSKNFASVTVATLLSSAQFGTSFPLSPSQVKSMFNATVNGGQILLASIFPGVNSGVTWNASQVMAYFQSLY